MWQNPSQRVRALAQARKRDRERARFPIHFKRISAMLEVANPGGDPGPAIEVRVALNDISHKGVGIFSPEGLSPGQFVTLNFQDPLKATLKGTVVYSQDHNVTSHVLSVQSYSFRIGIIFNTDSEEERVTLKRFVAEVGQSQLAHPLTR